MAEFVDPDAEPTPEKGEEPDYLRSEEFKDKVAMVEVAVNSAGPVIAETLKANMRKDMTREQAVAYARALGEMEADSRQEVGENKEMRVARAMAYAAWEWDGKPASSEAQRKEFGVAQALTPSLDRAAFGRLIKRGKQEEPEKKKRR